MYKADFFHSYRTTEKVSCHGKCSDFHSETKESEFFYPNACQICGCLGRLFSCSKCHMVSYCGKKHQTIHWPSHKTFCKVLFETSKRCKFLKNAKDRSKEAWTNARVAFINKVSVALLRKLTPYEEKVIKFIRACVVCYDISHYNLINCKNCASVSFCQKHKELFHKVHANQCQEFKLCYILDLEKLQENNNEKWEQEAKYPEEKDENIYYRWLEECLREMESNSKTKKYSEKEVVRDLDPNIKISVIKQAPIKSISYSTKRPDSMRSFLEIFAPRDFENNTSKKVIFEISDLFIKPLSTIQALENLRLVKKSDLVIHVIGAQVEDLDTYFFWEILLHWIPILTSLRIVLIGKEFVRQTNTPKICDKCAKTGKSLIFEMYNLSYTNFMEEENFSSPNLVIGFKIQIKKEAESLLSIANLNSSFAFTSDTEKFAKEDHKYMKKIFKQLTGYDVFEKNTFSGEKPLLDFETNGFIYEHQYLTIYSHF